MKDGETPVLSARWWKQNEPPGLRSAMRLETALRMYETALRRFDATSAEREAEEVLDALDDVDDAAEACGAEAAKLAKTQPPMAATVGCLKKFDRVIALARKSVLARVQASDDGEFGAAKTYQLYLLAALKRLRGAKQMNFGMVLGKQPDEHRIALQKSKSGKALAGMLMKATGLHMMTFGTARNAATRSDTIVLMPEGRDLSGLARKGTQMLKELQPLPYKRMEVAGDESDPDGPDED